MDYISSIFKYPSTSYSSIRKISSDQVSFAEFSVISIQNISKLCLLLGYERGFEV